MDNNTSEGAILQQMQNTRDSLAEKLETLEQKVVGTVENAKATVAETVDAIKETVHDTVASVQGTVESVQEGVKESVDSVKDFMDVPAHVKRHPWTMLGGSVAVGYCLGLLLTKNSSSCAPNATTGASWVPSPQFRPAGVPAPAAPAEPSIWDTEVNKLKGLALGVLFGTARELLVTSLPTQMGQQIKEVVDSVTRKVGGEPLPSSDWAKLTEPSTDRFEPEPAMEASSSKPPTPDFGNGRTAGRRW